MSCARPRKTAATNEHRIPRALAAGGAADAATCRRRKPLVRACESGLAGRSGREAAQGSRDRQEPSGNTYDPDDRGRAISCRASLNRGTTGAVAAPSRTGTAMTPRQGSNMAPSELGYFGGLFSRRLRFRLAGSPKDEVGTFTQEPPREALTAPPAGYQTPSPAAPYGVTKRTGTRSDGKAMISPWVSWRLTDRPRRSTGAAGRIRAAQLPVPGPMTGRYQPRGPLVPH